MSEPTPDREPGAKKMSPEEARAMPGAFKAYRRTDGELIDEGYAWIAEHHECGHWHNDIDTYEVEEVVMVPVRVRVFPCHDVPECEHEYEDGECVECGKLIAEPSDA